MTSQVLKQRLR